MRGIDVLRSKIQLPQVNQPRKANKTIWILVWAIELSVSAWKIPYVYQCYFCSGFQDRAACWFCAIFSSVYAIYFFRLPCILHDSGVKKCFSERKPTQLHM